MCEQSTQCVRLIYGENRRIDWAHKMQNEGRETKNENRVLVRLTRKESKTSETGEAHSRVIESLVAKS